MHERLAQVIAVQTEILQSSLGVDEAMLLVTEKAQLCVSAAGAVIEVVEGEELVYRTATGSAAPHVGTRVPIAQSLAGLCVQSGSVLQCDDSESDPRVNRDACRRVGVRSMVLVPLRHGQTRLGVLKVSSPEVAAFDEGDAFVLELLAGALGAAIGRAAVDEARLELLREREAAARARERAALERLEAEATLRVLFDAAPLLMSITTREADDLRILVANTWVARAYGRAAEELPGMLASELGIPPERLSNLLLHYDEAERTGAPVRFHYPIGAADSLRQMSATVFMLPRQEGGRRRFCQLTEDVTERESLRRRAEFTDRMATVGRLAAGVAHETNNPLAFLMANLTFLQQELGQEGRLGAAHALEIQSALADALEGAARIKRVVGDLYTYVKADSTQTAEVDLPRLIEQGLATARWSCGDRITMKTDFSATPRVEGNGAQLGQVFINLIANAAEAARRALTVRTGTLADGRAFVEIIDDGPGISSDVLPRIFDPFFTTKPVGQGMGLGLSTSQNIVRQHHGELQAFSDGESGTTFRVVLPGSREDGSALGG